jgi:hypothetical protein
VIFFATLLRADDEQQRGSVHSETAMLLENLLPALAGLWVKTATIAAVCDQ